MKKKLDYRNCAIAFEFHSKAEHSMLLQLFKATGQIAKQSGHCAFGGYKFVAGSYTCEDINKGEDSYYRQHKYTILQAKDVISENELILIVIQMKSEINGIEF